MSFCACSWDTGILASLAATSLTLASRFSKGTDSLMSSTAAASFPVNGSPVRECHFTFARLRRYSHMPVRYVPHIRA